MSRTQRTLVTEQQWSNSIVRNSAAVAASRFIGSFHIGRLLFPQPRLHRGSHDREYHPFVKRELDLVPRNALVILGKLYFLMPI
jgi:hypothetical protein